MVLNIIIILYKYNIEILTKDYFTITNQRENDRLIIEKGIKLNLTPK